MRDNGSDRLGKLDRAFDQRGEDIVHPADPELRLPDRCPLGRSKRSTAVGFRSSGQWRRTTGKTTPTARELTPFFGYVAPSHGGPMPIASHLTASAGELTPTPGKLAALAGRVTPTGGKATATRCHVTAMGVRGTRDTQRGDRNSRAHHAARRADQPGVTSHDRDCRPPDLDNGTGDLTRQTGSADN